MLEYLCLNYICSETVFVIGFKYPLGFQNSFNSSETAPLDSSSEDTSFKEYNHLCSLKTVHKNFLQANRDDMVRWYKLTFAISRKRDSRSLQCFTTTINLCPKDLLCSLSWVPMAVLTKVGVGFLRCHFSCYLLARRITFLSGITRSTGSAFAGAEGKLFLWWQAAK